MAGTTDELPAADRAAADEGAGPDTAEEIATPTLASRLRSWRTVLSFGVTFLLLGVAIWRAPINWGKTYDEIRGASLGLWLLGIAAYYGAMSLRAVRWQMLLRNTGEDMPLGPVSEILMASFFVNCVVPAKMGDLYRALQLRSREGAGGGNSLGSLIAERLIDLFTLMSLLLIAGAVTFHDRVPRQLLPGLIAGLVLCAVGIAALVILGTGRGRRVLAHLPEHLVERYERFRVGTIGAFGRWTYVIPLSLGIWGLEGFRLGFVIASLGLAGQVGPAHFLLVALVAALLTTVPFLPGGLGLVEGGIIVVLTQISTVSSEQAGAIALLDRLISYGTLIIIGGAFFLALHARPGRRSRAALTAQPRSR